MPGPLEQLSGAVANDMGMGGLQDMFAKLDPVALYKMIQQMLQQQQQPMAQPNPVVPAASQGLKSRMMEY